MFSGGKQGQGGACAVGLRPTGLLVGAVLSCPTAVGHSSSRLRRPTYGASRLRGRLLRRLASLAFRPISGPPPVLFSPAPRPAPRQPPAHRCTSKRT